MKLSEIHIRDPFIVLYNDKYYMYGTRGKGCWDTCSGFDVYISDDLVDWEGPKAVFEKGNGFWGTKQFWAPEVHLYKGKFYMFASFSTEGKCRGTHILVSDTPDGMFTPITENKITPEDWACLDGTLYVDKQGNPYIVFCHEWTQIGDGEVCAMKLSDDLTTPIGEPVILFKGSYAEWSLNIGKDTPKYVTDGPFLYRDNEDDLYLIWSSGSKKTGGYAQAFAKSDNGEIDGNWIHSNELLFEKDGGHGMIFKDKDGNLKMPIHTPNVNPNERPKIFDLVIENKTIKIK